MIHIVSQELIPAALMHEGPEVPVDGEYHVLPLEGGSRLEVQDALLVEPCLYDLQDGPIDQLNVVEPLLKTLAYEHHVERPDSWHDALKADQFNILHRQDDDGVFHNVEDAILGRGECQPGPLVIALEGQGFDGPLEPDDSLIVEGLYLVDESLEIGVHFSSLHFEALLELDVPQGDRELSARVYGVGGTRHLPKELDIGGPLLVDEDVTQQLHVDCCQDVVLGTLEDQVFHQIEVYVYDFLPLVCRCESKAILVAL